MKKIKGIVPELVLTVALVVGTIIVLTGILISATYEPEVAAPPVSTAQAEVQQVREAAPEAGPEPELIYEGDEIVMRAPEYYEALELLARVLHRENSNEIDGEEATWNTASVIINRINSSKYPNTLEDVIYQPGQYECINSLYKEEPTDIEWEVAAEVLNSGSILPSDVLYAAEFRQGSGVYDKVGKTYYCYE